MFEVNSVICGDSLEQMRQWPESSIDSIVTDPPYGLAFMGKRWDYDVPSVELWQECLRVLKPGGYLLAFAGTRTQHRMAVRIEDAGFEIRDMIAWVYGSGFPKSLDVSKAIDKAAGAEREVVGTKSAGASSLERRRRVELGYRKNETQCKPESIPVTTPATEAAKQWEGWHTALKPALEPITVARKPLIGTVAENVLLYGTGALNVDGTRIETDPNVDDPRLGGKGAWRTDKAAQNVYEGGYAGEQIASSSLGRWPANLIHDGSDDVLSSFPITTSGKEPANGFRRNARKKRVGICGLGKGLWDEPHDGGTIYGDSGSAARFFYCAKANKKDRGEGNNHPTVKPTDLMRYLVRLVTQPSGIVLDPFMGSGSTGKACVLEGFNFIGIDKNKEYVAIAKTRILTAKKGK